MIIGWKAGIEQYAPKELLEDTVAAEEAGFGSVDVSDHFHPCAEAGQAAFTWTWLGAAIARTSHIELGTGLTCPILRYNPTVIAQAAATCAVMSDERFYLGVGTGEALNEYAATAIWPEFEVRRQMLAESIDLMRELWSGDPITFDGLFYKTKKAKIYTLPQKQVPIYVSSLVPESAYFAGQYGDGLLTVGGQKQEVYKKMLRNFEKGAIAAGKDPSTMPKLIELNAALTDDVDGTISMMKKYWAGTFIPSLFLQKIYTPKMSEANGEIVTAEAIKQRMCLSEDPEDHILYIKQYEQLGFTNVYMHNPGPDQGSFIKAYGKSVIPEFKKNHRESKAQKRSTQFAH